MKLATVYVLPPAIETEVSTVPTAVFEQDKVTDKPSSGARAGEPAESWSCTIIAGYDAPSAGMTGGNGYTASVEGTGPMVVTFA